jgi:hypothetical protein
MSANVTSQDVVLPFVPSEVKSRLLYQVDAFTYDINATAPGSPDHTFILEKKDEFLRVCNVINDIFREGAPDLRERYVVVQEQITENMAPSRREAWAMGQEAFFNGLLEAQHGSRNRAPLDRPNMFAGADSLVELHEMYDDATSKAYSKGLSEYLRTQYMVVVDWHYNAREDELFQK